MLIYCLKRFLKEVLDYEGSFYKRMILVNIQQYYYMIFCQVHFQAKLSVQRSFNIKKKSLSLQEGNRRIVLLPKAKNNEKSPYSHW